MLSTALWPDVTEFRDHWAWRPDWTPCRPRLLWYLTFEDVTELHDTAAPYAAALGATGADLVPPAWRHLTVTDVGFLDELDDRHVRAARERVRERLSDLAPLELTFGPLGLLPGAVALLCRPAGPLRSLRELVRAAGAQVGIDPPDDIDGEFWPHVSLAYVNARTDHEGLRRVVRGGGSRTVQVRCRRLAQVLVTRADGHYRWEVVDQVSLGGTRGRCPTSQQAGGIFGTLPDPKVLQWTDH